MFLFSFFPLYWALGLKFSGLRWMSDTVCWTGKVGSGNYDSWISLDVNHTCCSDFEVWISKMLSSFFLNLCCLHPPLLFSTLKQHSLLLPQNKMNTMQITNDSTAITPSLLSKPVCIVQCYRSTLLNTWTHATTIANCLYIMKYVHGTTNTQYWPIRYFDSLGLLKPCFFCVLACYVVRFAWRVFAAVLETRNRMRLGY